jgi:hypothetical protein
MFGLKNKYTQLYMFGEYTGRRIKLTVPKFQTPRAQTTQYGVSGFIPPGSKSDPTSWNMDLIFDESSGFLDKIRDFEEKVISHVSQKSHEIFGYFVMEDDIRKDMFNSNLKGDSTMRLKLKSNPVTAVFDRNGLNITPESWSMGLHSNCVVAGIIEPVDIYFMNKTIGVVWVLHQMKIYEESKGGGGCCLFK